MRRRVLRREHQTGALRALWQKLLSRNGSPMHVHSIILAMTASVGLSHTALAEDLVLATPDALSALLQNAAMSVTQEKDDSGNPILLSATDGVNYDLFFFDCQDGKDCTSVQFSACFDMPDGVKMDVINKWNYDWRFGKVSVDGKNDPCLQMDIEMNGGISAKAFTTAIDTWTGTVAQFATTIGY